MDIALSELNERQLYKLLKLLEKELSGRVRKKKNNRSMSACLQQEQQNALLASSCTQVISQEELDFILAVFKHEQDSSAKNYR